MKSSVYQKIKEIEQRERYQLDVGDFIAKEIEALKNDLREFNGYQIGYHIPAGALYNLPCYRTDDKINYLKLKLY